MTAQKTAIVFRPTICLYIWFDVVAKKVEVGPASPHAQRRLEASQELRTHYTQAGTRVFNRHRNEGMHIVDPGTPVPHGALTIERLARELETELMNPPITLVDGVVANPIEWSVQRRPEP